MISHKYKCIFIHIQRTGGTSIERWLQGEDQWNLKHNYKHITTSYAKERAYPEYYDDYFKFTFVRNPYERVLSELYIKQMFNSRHMDLDLDNPDRLLTIRKGQYEDITCHGGSHINDHKEELKPNCIYQNILSQGVDKVYKYEEYDESLNDISSILGVKRRYDLPREGFRRPSSEHNGAIKYPIKNLEDLKPGDIEQINELYGSDFEEYGYERL